MTFNGFQPGQNLYGVGVGCYPESVEVPFYSNVAPSTTNTLFPIGKRWIQIGVAEYTLLSLSSAGGTLTANWALTTSTASVGVTGAMSGDPGAVTVTSTAITTSSIILYARATGGGTLGNVEISTQTTGSFTLTSSSTTETSTFYYQIIN